MAQQRGIIFMFAIFSLAYFAQQQKMNSKAFESVKDEVASLKEDLLLQKTASENEINDLKKEINDLKKKVDAIVLSTFWKDDGSQDNVVQRHSREIPSNFDESVMQASEDQRVYCGKHPIGSWRWRRCVGLPDL